VFSLDRGLLMGASIESVSPWFTAKGIGKRERKDQKNRHGYHEAGCSTLGSYPHSIPQRNKNIELKQRTSSLHQAEEKFNL